MSNPSSDLGTLAENIRKHALQQAGEEWIQKYSGELMRVLHECGLASIDRGRFVPTGKFKAGKSEITADQLVDALHDLFTERRTNILYEKLTKRLLLEATTSLNEEKEPPDILK